MKAFGQQRVMVTTDHFTPLTVKTHTTEPVPFAMCGTGIGEPAQGLGGFSEAGAEAQGLLLPDGYLLMERFIRA
jgi:2,3-bisphosphoglycerate-independent phosphoglycerate mutase